MNSSPRHHIELGDVCMIPQQQITVEFPVIFYVAIAEWAEADRKFAKIGKIDQIWNNFNEIFSEQNQNRDIQLNSSVFDKFGLKFRNSAKYQQYLIYQQSFEKHVQKIKHKNDQNIEIYEKMITNLKLDASNKASVIEDLVQKVDANASFSSQVSTLEHELEEIAHSMIMIKDQHNKELTKVREQSDKQRLKLEAEIQRLLACRFLDHIKRENANKNSSFM